MRAGRLELALRKSFSLPVLSALDRLRTACEASAAAYDAAYGDGRRPRGGTGKALNAAHEERKRALRAMLVAVLREVKP